MKVYSCNYPIYHSFENNVGTTNDDFIEYEIILKLSGHTVYSGKINPYDVSEDEIRIDLSPICRQYLETFYENMTFNNDLCLRVPYNGNYSTIHTFIVKSGSNLATDSEIGGTTGGDIEYPVIYDYNTEYQQKFIAARCLNDPIDIRVDPRQRVNLSGYNVLADSQSYSWSIEGTNIETYQIARKQPDENFYHLLSINLNKHKDKIEEGDTIILSQDEWTPEEGWTPDGEWTVEDEKIFKKKIVKYVVVPECKNRFVLYYVNRYGGLDSLLMSGKAVESWNPNRLDVKLHYDRSNRLSFQQKRILTENDHKWELNTGLLTNEKAGKIHHLIYSPKVFIHDLENDTISSCLITDTNYSVKNSRYDLVQYTVNIKESQKQIIY